MGSSQEDANTKPVLLGNQLRFFETLLIPTLQRLIGGIPEDFISGFPTFDQPVPGLNRTQQLSLAGLENIASGGESGVAGGDTFQTGREAITGLLSGEPSDFEGFFRSTVQDPAIEALQEDILPQLASARAGRGTIFGSPLVEGEQRAIEDLNDALVRGRTQLAFQVDEAAKNRQLEAAGLIPTVTQAESALLASLFGGAEQGRLVEREQFQQNLILFDPLLI